LQNSTPASQGQIAGNWVSEDATHQPEILSLAKVGMGLGIVMILYFGSPNTYSEFPAAIATYSFPSNANAMGEA